MNIRMSSGGRVQLAAIGAQDIYLTSNPQMSYFIKNYKRHTMFAMQTAEAPFQQECLFGHKARCNIPRIGDLVREVYLKVELPELNQGILKTYDSVTQAFINIDTYPAYCDSIGHALIKQATLKIGGQTVEIINGDYLEIYSDMFIPKSQSFAIEQLVGRTYERAGMGPASNVSYRTQQGFAAVGAFPRTFIVPLRFYQTQDPNLAIPLTSLTKQEVEVEILFEDVNKLIINTQKLGGNENIKPYIDTTLALGNKPVTITNASLLVDYIFLGKDEADYFRSAEQSYLITQVQGLEAQASKLETYETRPKQIKTTFTNPVKETFMVVQADKFRPRDSATVDTTVTNYFEFKSTTVNIPDNLKSLELLFNGQPRVLSRIADSFYLRIAQPLQAHTKIPQRYIYNYSFSLDPENYQPTGQVNYSRIKDVYYNMYLNPATDSDRNIRIYAKSYNVLQINSGLGGLLFNT
jgi:hypothetical protein